MKNKEIEELLNELKDKYSYEPYDTTGKVYTTISYEEGQLLLSYIEQLKKKAELGEHYKHLYSEVKKQKDDAFEYIKKNKDKTIMPYGDNEDTDFEVCLFEEDINELLRMLGERDE